MSTRIKRLFVALVAVCLVLLMPTVAGAAADFTIKDYAVDIIVQDDNSYLVTEQITQDYHNPAHGMYRVFNLAPQTVRESNGTERWETNSIRIKNIDVDNTYSTMEEDNWLQIRIGDGDEYVTGLHTDTINYRYVVGDDKISEFDEFNYNIIGEDWETPISGVQFNIQMPHDFDAENVGFSVGPTGSVGYDEQLLHWQVDGRSISGRYDGMLHPGDALTIRLELPEGYYTSVFGAQEVTRLGLLLAGIVTAVFLLLFILFRNKDKPIQTVEFHPPEGMTSADVGCVVDGVVEDKDVLSLLIYWADKGYLEIHQGDGKNDISFVKKQDLPEDANDYETIMFTQLFLQSDKVEMQSLENTFYTTVEVVQKRIIKKYNEPENRVFTKKSLALQMLGRVLAVLPVTLMFICTAAYEMGAIVEAVLVSTAVAVFAFAASSGYVSVVHRWQSEKRSKKASSLVIWLLLSAVLYGVVGWICAPTFGVMISVPIACSVLLTVLTPFFRTRTRQGLLWQGRILGLKNFIQKTELSRLEMLMEEDPSYFYHVLPYAYVLGLSDTWAKQFETLAIEPPTWYYGSSWSMFNAIYFTSALNRSLSSAQQSMFVKPESRSGTGGFGGGGGGFSGGGFSGGGFGGGGGGSW